MEWQRFDTECGAPLWFLSIPHLEHIVVAVLVNSGFRDERRPEEEQFAHLVEHYVHRGGTRCHTTFSELTTHVEDVGGEIDAATMEEMTLFFHKIHWEEVARSVHILSDSLCSPAFLEDALRIQVDIIQHELEGRRDQPTVLLFDEWQMRRLVGHPLAQIDSARAAKSLRSASRAGFLDFFERHYYPENFTYIAIGRGDPGELLDLLNQNFASRRRRNKNVRPSVPPPPLKETRFVLSRNVDKAYVVSGSIGGGANDQDTTALKLFSFMISAGLASPLFQEVREKHAYCYSIEALLDENSDVSYFFVAMDALPETYGQALELSFAIIQREKRNEALLGRAKKMLKGKLSIVSDTEEMLDRAAKEIALYGAPRSSGEMAAVFNAVTIDDVTRAVDRYLRPEQFYTGLVLPKKS